jgi:6-phosphogluconolactonase (cycloisomerase 2 family)
MMTILPRAKLALFLLPFVAGTCVVAPARADEITFVETLKQDVNGVAGMNGASDPAVSPDGRNVYVAAYSASSIAIFDRDPATGQLSYAGKVTNGVDGAVMLSAFTTDVSPDGKNVYAGSPSSNSIVAFTRNPATGALTLFNNYLAASLGITTAGYISVSVSPDGKSVYGVGGSIDGLAVFARDLDTGALSFLEEHRDNVDGNMLGQGFSPTASPINNIAISADNAFLYVTSTDDNAVTVFARNPTTGALTRQSVVVDGVDGVDGIQGASSLVLSPDNESLYVSGQGESSIAIFNRNATTGALTYVGKRTQGSDGITTLAGARSLAVSPDGRYVYISAITSNAITVFNRDATTGDLTFATAATQGVGGVDGIGSVSGMVTDPLSRNLYAAGQTASDIAVFRLPVPAVVLSSTSLTVDESGPSAQLDAGLEVYDADDATWPSAKIAIGSGFVAGDTLSVTPKGNIVSSYDAATGVLTLTGVDTLANYRDVMRTARFAAAADPGLDTGQTGTKTVYFQAFDGQNESAQATVTVSVNGFSVPSSYTLTYTAGAHGSIVGASPQTVSPGASGTAVTAVGATGYHFTQWSDSLQSASRTDTNVNANLSFTASFAINTYTVTASASGEGSITPASATVDHGATRAFTLAPNAGWYVASVSGCGGSLNGNTFTTGAITAGCAVTASFEKVHHTVTASAGTGGSISPTSVAAMEGETASFTVTPESGYAVSSVQGCGGTLNGNVYTTAAITGACSISASFDNRKPVFNPASPADLDIKAHALLVDLPADVKPTATDRDGKAVEVTLVGGKTRFAPGHHMLTWRAVDGAGLEATVQQVLRVWPTVAMGKDVQLGLKQGNSASFRIVLNGLSPQYPFSVHYTATGDLTGHDLESGTAVFEKGELEKDVFFAVTEPPSSATDKLIDVELTDDVNRATRYRLQVKLVAMNAAPTVSITGQQQGEARPVFARDGGPITLAANVQDANSDDTHTLSWTYPSGAMASVENGQLVLQPESLAAGVHHIDVLATDSGSPPLTARGTLDIVIAQSAPALPAGVSTWAPSGLPDDPAYAPPSRNVLPEQQGTLDEYLLEADAGVQLALGANALLAGNFQAQVQGSSIPADTLANVGGYFDFRVSDLPVAGQAVSIVIPQRAAIPANAVYRKLDSTGRWRNFIEGANDVVASAPGRAGFCPPPQSEEFRVGLHAGDFCVRLTISDGGANDADGQANGSVVDPGGVAALRTVVVTPAGSGKRRGGGGAMDPVTLLFGFGMLVGIFRMRRSRC